METKPIVQNEADVTCKNCIYSALSDELDFIYCVRTQESMMDEAHILADSWCGEGEWLHEEREEIEASSLYWLVRHFNNPTPVKTEE